MISEWERPCLFYLSIFDFRQEIHIHDFRKKHRMSSRYYSGKAMSSSSFDFYETPMPSVSFCLPTPFDCLYLFTYRSRPVQTNKKIDDFFFACGCRAGILFDFQMIIERGPEIFTGEPGEIIVDSLQSPVMLTAKKQIQYFYHQTILDSNVGQGAAKGRQRSTVPTLLPLRLLPESSWRVNSNRKAPKSDDVPVGDIENREALRYNQLNHRGFPRFSENIRDRNRG